MRIFMALLLPFSAVKKFGFGFKELGDFKIGKSAIEI